MGSVATWGDPSAPALVLVHGFMGCKEDWEEVATLLSHSHRCIAVDLPGHGESPIGDDETFATAATRIIEAVDELDIATFRIFGYSMGARLALYMAVHYSMRIDAAVIESGSPGLKREEERAKRRDWDDAKAAEISDGGIERFVRAWYEQPLFASLGDHPELRAELIQRRTNNDAQSLSVAMRLLGTGRQMPLWHELKDHHVPTLFIAGGRDEKYTALAHEMAALSPEGHAHVVENAGHIVHCEQQQEFVRIVDSFLSDV